MAGEIKRVIRIDGTQAEAALRAVGAAAERTATAVGKAARSVGAQSQQIAKVASTMQGRVSAIREGAEKLGSAVGGPIGGSVGQVVALAQGIGQVGAALGPVGVVAVSAGAALFGVATAGAAVTAAAVGLVRSAGEAADRLEKLRGIVPFDQAKVDRVQDANKAFTGLSTAADMLTVSLGDELGPTVKRGVNLITAMTLAFNDVIVGSKYFTEGVRLLIDFALSPLDTAISVGIEGLQLMQTALGIELPPALAKMQESFKKAIRPTKEMDQALTFGTVTLSGYIAQAEILNQSADLAKHAERVTEAAKAEAEARKKATDELKRYAEAARDAVRAVSGLAGSGLGGINTASLREQAARRGFALADDRNSLANLRAAEIDRLARALQTAPVDRSAGRRGMTGSAALQGAIGASQALAGGDVLGLLGMAGPQGAAAAAIVGAIQTLGEQGAAQVGQQIQATASAIGEGLRQIPVLLGEVLPSVLSDTLPDLVVALAESLPAILREAFLFQFRLTKELFTTIPQQLGEAFGRALGEWWERAKEFVRLILTGQWREAAGGGDRTARERLGRASRIGLGIATLGTSELAIRGTQGILDGLGIERGRDRSREARRERGGGGGGVSVFVDSLIADAGAVERLARRISRETGDRGRRLGWGGR